MPKYAYLCTSCAKKDYCVKCGKWCGSTKHLARLCSSCSGSFDRCVKCGKMLTNSNRVPAVLCNNCGFGSKQNYCVKCGKSAP